MEIKGIIFDVDGVIINTEKTHWLAFRRVLKGYGYDLLNGDYLKYFCGKSIRGGVLSLLADHNLPGSDDIDNLVEAITKKKIEYTLGTIREKVDYYSDAIELIQRLAIGKLTLKGIGEVVSQPKLAMTTGLERIYFRYILANHDLKRLFPVLITPEQYRQSKPDPECYLKTLEAMKLKASEVIGIEDTVSGVEALNRAGIFSVAVTNTYQRSELARASVVVGSLRELMEKVQP